MSMVLPEELYGIIGYPLGHSLSPLLFTSLFAEIHRPAVYFKWETPPEKVADVINAVRTLHICGLSVTIPHKEVVIPYLDELSERAEFAGAVNTIYWKEDRLCGDNMDIAGFLAPLEKKNPKRALVLGCGGAARAVLAGLRERNIPTLLTGRSAEKAEKLATEFDATVLSWNDRSDAGKQVDLLINATPLGMQGKFEKDTPFPFFDTIANTAKSVQKLAYDLVYRPNPTRFLREASAAGWETQGGLDMFAAQAKKQFFLWTGQEIPEKSKAFDVLQ